MKKFKLITSSIFLGLTITLTSCGGTAKNGGQKAGFNLFPVSQDIALGAQVAHQIDSNKAEFPQLDSVKYKAVYDYLYNMRNTILNTGNVTYKNDFTWRLRIVHNDKVQNAFCTPGGYIYIYTGIMKYMESGDQLAGVLGHEMAHADLRHSTQQMSKSVGTGILTSVILGDRAALAQVTAALIGLKYSRGFEEEADAQSVFYLCPTPYNAAGGAGFFEKIEAAGGSRPPEFLSTHPNPVNRIQHFKDEKARLNCLGTQTYETEYKRIINMLPK